MALIGLCLFQRDTKISNQNLCPDLRVKNLGAVQSSPTHGWAQGVPAKADWHVDPGGLQETREEWGQTSTEAVPITWLLCLPPEAEALLRACTEND